MSALGKCVELGTFKNIPSVKGGLNDLFMFAVETTEFQSGLRLHSKCRGLQVKKS